MVKENTQQQENQQKYDPAKISERLCRELGTTHPNTPELVSLARRILVSATVLRNEIEPKLRQIF